MSKRLVDLDPRFIVTAENARRVGVSFACPACGAHRVSVNVDPPFDAGPPAASAIRGAVVQGVRCKCGGQLETVPA